MDWLACLRRLGAVPSVHPGDVRGPRRSDPFYNAGGWGAAIVANFPPLLWFLVVSILLIWKRRHLPRPRVPPNQRMKLSRRSGHFWWYKSYLIVAAPPRSLCAIR